MHALSWIGFKLILKKTKQKNNYDEEQKTKPSKYLCISLVTTIQGLIELSR
jgi:hypothetical protein